jgi:hypothetical protein
VVPRYFFNIRDGATLITDDEGMEFTDLAEVRDEAVATLPQIAKDELPDGDEHLFAVYVLDEQERPVVTVTSGLIPNGTSRQSRGAQSDDSRGTLFGIIESGNRICFSAFLSIAGHVEGVGA